MVDMYIHILMYIYTAFNLFKQHVCNNYHAQLEKYK